MPGARKPNRFTVGAKIIRFAFGRKLIKFAERVRTECEAKYVSADGRVDRPTASRPRNKKREAGFKAALKAGHTVEWRSSGDSLVKIGIRSNECCRYQPVSTHDDVKKGDIVFCQIKQRYWQHLVKSKTFVGGAKVWLYTISNGAGHVNGTIPLKNIYGKLIDHWR